MCAFSGHRPIDLLWTKVTLEGSYGGMNIRRVIAKLRQPLSKIEGICNDFRWPKANPLC